MAPYFFSGCVKFKNGTCESRWKNMPPPSCRRTACKGADQVQHSKAGPGHRKPSRNATPSSIKSQQTARNRKKHYEQLFLYKLTTRRTEKSSYFYTNWPLKNENSHKVPRLQTQSHANRINYQRKVSNESTIEQLECEKWPKLKWPLKISITA